jgi:transposase InsO family protein
VVGWAIDVTATTRLALTALQNAVQKRRPTAGLLHHSDRGCQYTSFEYRQRLEALGITVSMSRTGNCWDSAVAESFFATLKSELIHRRRWHNALELRAALFEYIEVFYNRRRLHSSLDYRTPAAVEQEYLDAA